MSKKILSALFLLGLLLISCDPQMVFDQLKSTGNERWAWDESKSFEIPMEDSTQLYNIYINLRHTKEFPFENLYVFLLIKSPDGAVLKDTVNIPLANARGKWLGDGFGNIKFVRKKYREGVRFGNSGVYSVELSQGMRVEEVPVTDIGIRIEKYTDNK